MTTWNLAAIRTKTRQLSGRISPTDLSNDRIDEFINSYVQYEFPATVRLKKQKVRYSFNTVIGQRDYDYNNAYVNLLPQASCDDAVMAWYINADLFDQYDSFNVARNGLWVGDGVETAFSATLSTPIWPESLIIDDQSQALTDNGSGNLTGDGSGTIDYDTGALSVTFTDAPADGQSIDVSYYTYSKAKPTAILLMPDVVRLDPVPDKIYRIEMNAYSSQCVQTSAGVAQDTFINGSDVPRLQEWGLLFSIGSARRIVADGGETESYQYLTALYQEQLDLITQRTIEELQTTRALPRW